MFLSRPLLWWYFRSAWFVTLPAAIAGIVFTVFYTNRLTELPALAWAFIFAHSALLAQATSRFDSPAAAFLYTRGFSRDQLWTHRVAAHLLCVAVVWLPASLIVWLGLRSSNQDFVVQNPDYPLFRAEDYFVPVGWLVGYLLAMGFVLYAPIRVAHPTRSRGVGHALAYGGLLAGAVLMNLPMHAVWQSVLAYGSAIAVSIVLLCGSWRLHRQIEVIP